MNDFVFSVMLLGALSSGNATPFWAVSNTGGLMPESNGALALVQAYKPFDESKTFQWEAGASLAASWQPSVQEAPVSAMVDELYAGVRWKVLRADIGMMHREREFLGSDKVLGSLSVTEGHIVESNNSRAMPGYSLVLEPWAIPFTGEHLLISGLWGDYRTIDSRYMQDALVHRMRASLRYDTRMHFYIQIGLDHYALWGGHGPDGSTMKLSLGNYLRICTGRSAAPGDGTVSDTINCLGDHGGAEQLRMGWRARDWDLTFQYEKPYSDRSGMRFNNIPDGAYTLHWSLRDKDNWVTDLLAEFHYTMWQSGTIQDEEVDENGKPLNWYENRTKNFFGLDNYFCNGEYKSGWTHFGRAICSPLFTTGTKEGIRQIVNNRYKAVHLGVSGKLFRVAPYRLMLTWSDNYGTYGTPFIAPSSARSGWNWWEPNTIDKGLKQLSAGFSGYVPFSVGRRGRLDLTYGLYADAGELLKETFGATLGVRYNL